MDLPLHWRGTDDLAAHGVRAQLLLAFLLGALLPPFLLMIPRATHQVALNLQDRPPKSIRFHRLEIAPDGRIRIDGDQVDIFGLRMRLDRITAQTDDWIDFRPDPHARYELFMEVLAVTKRAHVERLRLNNSAFRRSID